MPHRPDSARKHDLHSMWHGGQHSGEQLDANLLAKIEPMAVTADAVVLHAYDSPLRCVCTQQHTHSLEELTIVLESVCQVAAMV